LAPGRFVFLRGTVSLSCGGASDAETPARTAGEAPPDACALLTAADLEGIFGSEVGTPKPGQAIGTAEAGMTSCAWKTVDGKAGVSLGLRRGAQYRPDPAAFEQYAAEFEKNMSTRPEVQPVPGLGSAALWDATNHVLMVRPASPGAELNVQPYLQRSVPMVDLPTARAVAEAAIGGL
jgi:hypothetical protein